jgi:phospholipase D1/2
MQRPDQNFHPPAVPNNYDYGSPEDHLVQDPLAENFLNFWNSRARRNTDAFGRIFHPVPHDSVHNWKDYEQFYEQFFVHADTQAAGTGAEAQKPKYEYGHVVAEEFGGATEQGVVEMKELLSTIKGTIVEMPLMFLIEEDIAKEGLSLNSLTEQVYT